MHLRISDWSRPRGGLFLLLCCALSVRAVELPYRNEATRQLLLDALRDPDRVVRLQAVRALISVSDPRNAAELESVSRDPIDAVRRQTTWGVERLAPTEDFVPRPKVPLEQVSDVHRDPRVRLESRLRKLQSDAAFQSDFSPLLQDPDDFVRRGISARVVEERGQAALPVWRRLLGSDRLDDRVEAAWAVGRLSSKEDEAALIGFLDSDSERLRRTAIVSLEDVGGEAACAILGDAILRATGKTQEALIRLTTKLSAWGARPALRALAGDAKAAMPARLLALDALRAMTDSEARPLLLEMIRDNDPNHSVLREHAAGALGALGATGAPEAVAFLKRLITDKVIPVPMMGPSYEVDPTRIACLLALEKLQARDTVQSLLGQPFLNETSEDLRRTLAEVLTRMTGRAFDYRRSVVFHPHFIESLSPEEYPAELAENLKKPPVFEKP